MKSTIFILLGTTFGFAHAIFADPIPPGTQIDVRSDTTIDARDSDGRIYPGFVMHDVADRDGRIVIRRGAPAELIVRRFGPRDFAIDLESVTVDGRRYSIDASDAERIHREGEGRRTGEYAGGGAIVGSIIGAIAGGGKGAAIGALAGGAAGASTAVITRGERVYIPAESVLSFRIERPLDIYPDAGYDRDGNHYHRDWDYRRDDDRRDGDRDRDRDRGPEYPPPPPPQ
ncbi:MAG TPA: hypothetical protein VK789_26360 [Bryobacteraceae bacterium]|nr:hypothetical protein [Bryobacteraceae bacterium]